MQDHSLTEDTLLPGCCLFMAPKAEVCLQPVSCPILGGCGGPLGPAAAALGLAGLAHTFSLSSSFSGGGGGGGLWRCCLLLLSHRLSLLLSLSRSRWSPRLWSRCCSRS